MNNFIHEDYISDLTICDELIKWFHSNKKLHRPGEVSSKSEIMVDYKDKKSIDFSFNLSDTRKDVKIVESYAQELQTILERYLLVYKFADEVAPFRISEQVNIQYYEPYGGYKSIHIERDGDKSSIWRHLVFQTYLNSVENGGETEFIYQQYKCAAVKGKTLIWPVEWTHPHRGIVSPNEGKYVITGWYSFGG